LIGRISEHRQFERLTHDGRRARSAHLWCRYLDDPDVVPPRVAFAIGRAVGGAVTRNRLRRRLRELLRAAVVSDPPRLVRGQLLIGVRPPAAELSFGALSGELDSLLRALGAPSRTAVLLS
jgi:ribonuclease P protein component